MTWTYTGDPENSILDRLRLLMGDTDTNDQQLTDEVLNYYLAQNNNEAVRAAIDAVNSLIAKYSRQVTASIENVSVSSGGIVTQYRKLLIDLKGIQANKGIRSGLKPVISGISKAESQSLREKTDLRQPEFTIGQFDDQSDCRDEKK